MAGKSHQLSAVSFSREVVSFWTRVVHHAPPRGNKQMLMQTGDTIYAQPSMLYAGVNAHNISFIGNNYGPNGTMFTSQDDIFMYGRNDSITLTAAHWTNIHDLGTGLHVVLNGCASVTIRDFERDPGGRIDLYNSGYQSRADMLAHKVVYTAPDSGGYSGTMFTTLHGDPVLNIIGDTNVRASQVVFHS
jgi:hypothetical protein